MNEEVGGALAPLIAVVLLAGAFFLFLRGGQHEARRDANMVLVLWLVFFLPGFLCTSVSVLSAMDAGNYSGTGQWVVIWALLGVSYAAATILVTVITARIFLRKMTMAVSHFALLVGALAAAMLMSGFLALTTWLEVINFTG